VNYRSPNFYDMTGRILGCLTVLREAPSHSSSAAWFCLCSQCGETTTELGYVLRQETRRWTRCGSCPTRAQTRRLEGQNAPPRLVVKDNFHEPKRDRRKPCKLCCDLSWQRPKWGCAGCDQPYAPEIIERWERQQFSAIALCERVI
jgi:hypothetical protein